MSDDFRTGPRGATQWARRRWVHALGTVRAFFVGLSARPAPRRPAPVVPCVRTVSRLFATRSAEQRLGIVFTTLLREFVNPFRDVRLGRYPFPHVSSRAPT